MTTYDVPHPPIVSREQWLVARKKLLAQEKELTRQYDRVNAVRRRLPMVRIEKNYMFEGPGGEESLLDLFQGRRQLLVYHFMFDPNQPGSAPKYFMLLQWSADKVATIRDFRHARYIIDGAEYLI